MAIRQLAVLSLGGWLWMGAAAGAWADAPKTAGTSYTDYYGNHVTFPMGDISFADEVVSFVPGKPHAKEKWSKPELALGPPDFDKKTDSGYVTLGCGGVLVLHFVDNAIVDVKGDDIFLFEVPTDLEPTSAEISQDGKNWINVGTFKGGTASLDISKKAKKGEAYTFIRLTDLKSTCYGDWPGADIDAIGAIGSGVQLSLKSAVLFDAGKSGLRPDSDKELARLAQSIKAIPGATVLIDGHTDSQGSMGINLKLSRLRAEAVKNELVTRFGIDAAAVKTRGIGPGAPVAPNDTAEGRERNRRVEIVVIPPK